MGNSFYPHWVRCFDGADRIVKNAMEHSSLTGIPYNEDGTPQEVSTAEPQAEPIEVGPVMSLGDVEPAPKPRRGRPPKQKPAEALTAQQDVDPLAESVAPWEGNADVNPA